MNTYAVRYESYVRVTITKFIKNENCELIQAKTVEEAVEKAKVDCYKFKLLDVHKVE